MASSYCIGILSLSRSFMPDYHYQYFEGVYDEFKCQSPEIEVRRLVLENIDSLTEEEGKCIRTLDIIMTDPQIFENKLVFNYLDQTKWIQMFTAGVESITEYYADKPPPKFLLSRNAGFFDAQMVEYVMGHIISGERFFQEYRNLQKARSWKKLHCRSTDDLTVGIIGYGSVGKKIAEVALIFGMKVIALLRTDKTLDTRHPEDFKNIILTTDLLHLLQSSDYIVSILPNIPDTNGFFDRDIFSHCKNKKPVFINIGRGNVVNEASVIKALDEGCLGHVVLDVFENEPLQSNSPLWEREDVTITPHISGSLFIPRKFVDMALKKYHRFVQRKTIDHVVDWSKGY